MLNFWAKSEFMPNIMKLEPSKSPTQHLQVSLWSGNFSQFPNISYIFGGSVTPNYCRRNNIIENLVEPYLLCEFQLSLIIFRRCMAVILFLTLIMALTWRHWRQINIRLDNFEDLVYTFPQWKFLIILITYHHLMALLVHLTTH